MSEHEDTNLRPTFGRPPESVWARDFDPTLRTSGAGHDPESEPDTDPGLRLDPTLVSGGHTWSAWPPPAHPSTPYPEHPAFPGQPAWSPTRPERGNSLTTGLVLVMLALMLGSAVAGGFMGAWANQRLSGDAEPGRTVVLDGPQLDRASLASVASEVQPSVVSISAGSAEGSGVIMSEDGYILTNAHVVESSRGGRAQVRFSNGQVVDATIVGADARSDLAVIQVEGVSDLTPATFGDSDELLVGDTVLAIGSPLGLRGTVTQGIVSALDRTLTPGGPDGVTLTGLLQTDASINPGNSGGPLVNLKAEVIGINTAIATTGTDTGFLGVGFAIPSNHAKNVADQLIAGEEVRHAYLGVTVAPAEGGGAVIGEVVPDGPAAAAGLRPGDIVVRVGERQITDSNDLVSAVRTSEVGARLEIEYLRGGVTRVTEVTLADLPD